MSFIPGKLSYSPNGFPRHVTLFTTCSAYGTLFVCLFVSLVIPRTSDLKCDTPVATLSGAWLYEVSLRTGWPGVSIQ